jgi:hypothetical protein
MTPKFLFPIIAVFLITSCSEEKKIEPKKTDSTEEIAVLSPQEFHNTLASKVNDAHVLISALKELDDQDATPEVIAKTATTYLNELDLLINGISELTPTGELGTEIKDLTLQYVSSKKAIITVYIDFAPQLSIESEWTDEDYALWTSNAEPYFGISDQMFKELTDLQALYLAKNNITEKPL